MIFNKQLLELIYSTNMHIQGQIEDFSQGGQDILGIKNI